MMNSKIKKCFTLAEVLITLAVIGVVAALVIPNVIRNYQKHITVVRLKAAYSTIAKALNTAEAYHGSITSWYSQDDIMQNYSAADEQSFLSNFANKYIIPYMRVVDSGEKTLAQFGYPNGILRLNGTTWISGSDSVYGMQLSNGMFIYLDFGSNSGKVNEQTIKAGTRIRFVVDHDGPKHGPNQSGRDSFLFAKYISSDPHLAQFHPEGLYNTIYRLNSHNIEVNPLTREWVLDKCNMEGTGTCCSTLIMLDGWKISDDYPWL